MHATETNGKVESDCELCREVGGSLVWEDALCRVVSVADSDYPGFCRVILQRHLAEMTDLPSTEQMQLMRVVLAVESAILRLYRPDKVNLASFGNLTPHVHWHVTPRWRDDRHFPNPIWGLAQRNEAPIRERVDDRRLGGEITASLNSV